MLPLRGIRKLGTGSCANRTLKELSKLSQPGIGVVPQPTFTRMVSFEKLSVLRIRSMAQLFELYQQELFQLRLTVPRGATESAPERSDNSKNVYSLAVYGVFVPINRSSQSIFKGGFRLETKLLMGA